MPSMLSKTMLTAAIRGSQCIRTYSKLTYGDNGSSSKYNVIQKQTLYRAQRVVMAMHTCMSQLGSARSVICSLEHFHVKPAEENGPLKQIAILQNNCNAGR